MNRSALLLVVVLAIATPFARAQTVTPLGPDIVDIPAGDYRLDPARSTITFRVSHLYVSSYTATFKRFDARLHLDPAHPDRASISTTIDTNSLVLAVAPPGFREVLLGPDLLDTAHYPASVFRSTKVVLTAPDRARVTGDFTVHGVTRPIDLTVIFKGGVRATAAVRQARVMFSVKTRFKRSLFGLGAGSRLIAGDQVDVDIEAEFTCAAKPK